MYTGSLESTRYLLLTEFEGRTACNRTSFFRSDLWPKHKVRRSHKLSRKKQVSTYTQYLCYKATIFLRYLHLALKGDGPNPHIVVNDSATYSFNFLAALEINLPNDSFLKDFSCIKNHLVFAGVYCNENRFISRTVTTL